jgi:hypothetical protein
VFKGKVAARGSGVAEGRNTLNVGVALAMSRFKLGM